MSRPPRLVIVSLMAAALVTTIAPQATAYQRPGETVRISAPIRTESLLPPGILTVDSYGSAGAQISANGRFVVFDSDRPDLVEGDTNLVTDIFVRDLKKGTTERVSVSSAGEEGRSFPTNLVADGRCYWVPGLSGVATPTRATGGAVINANGRYVAFYSCFDNLVPGDDNRKPDAFVHDRVTNTTTRVNVSTQGKEVPRSTSGATAVALSISAGGRYVAFTSAGSNLVEGDTNGLSDAFVHDRKTRVTERVSVSSEEEQMEQGTVSSAVTANCPSLSGNGRYVAFSSPAANLVEGDTNDSPDVFVRDRKSGTTERVSTASDDGEAAEGANTCYFDVQEPPKAAISGDGRYVTFTSLSTDLVPNHTKNPLEVQDTYVKDRHTGRVERISVTSFGEEVRGPSEQGAISLNGRFIVFWAYNSYSPADTGDWESWCRGCGDPDVFVSDRQTGAVDWASVTERGGEPQHCDPAPGDEGFFRLDETTSSSAEGTISASGRYVAFVSCGDNVTSDDEDTVWDVFVRDRGIAMGVGDLEGPPEEPDPDPSKTCITPDICIPICITPEICIPPEGRYSATDKIDRSEVLEDGADLIELSVANRPRLRDLFVTAELAHMPSLHVGAAGMISTTGSPGLLYGLRFEVEERSYEVHATSLLGGTFGLFDCTASRPSCTKIADLRGGYGTTGERVVFSLPLERIGLENGGELSGVEAFSAVGTYLTGSTEILDHIRLD